MTMLRGCEGWECPNTISHSNRSGLCRSCSNKQRFQQYDPRQPPVDPPADPDPQPVQGELDAEDDRPEGNLFDLDERWLQPEVRHRALAYRFGHMIRNNQGTAPQVVSLYVLLRDDTASSEHRADALMLIDYLRNMDTEAGAADLDIIDPLVPQAESAMQ